MNYQWRNIIGVDEVGRGALAGPLVAAAVRVRDAQLLRRRDIKDSKLLSPRRRQELFVLIKKYCDVRFGVVSAATIDRQGLLKANVLAVELALRKFDPELQVLMDYIAAFGRYATTSRPYELFIRGDQRYAIIAAASIAAKVYRDRLMLRWHSKFPSYGFAAHKGYGTPRHQRAIRQYGPSRIHRQLFLRHT